ncbi:MFS transporter [Pseudooceanicola sediminis]|uniref:MFS transporter n=1 Tax=Pseudooceanicola sediminis TaxID=2211117 RepID=A0A399J174_9RHOB|nr:MFS transporter [Pseudooceanicola sediminis]KAA2316268.1 MFS transporter [Puniceibacterium sp. HSS470]RII39178.1 MFS transporter [Pseudooceanicola sediminis]|tara:strand:- start:63860 stop:65056 length:1197 start_codon:yes stop_codon:yes gene_type:complete
MSVTEIRSNRIHRTGFYLVLTGVALMMAGASAPSPFYPILQRQIGFSPAVMTGIFAIYTIALLCTLLVAGSLSDHIGRRPVLSAAFAVLAVSLVMFWQADTVGTLLFARVVQGVASGLLLSTLSAAAVDLEPVDKPGSAAIWTSVLPLGGLGLGALASGAILDFSSAAKPEVFGSLVAIYAALAALVLLLPETAPRHDGIWSALRPRMGLPRSARKTFLRSAPAVFAGWATGGFYLSLGAPIIAQIFGVTDYLLQALVITLLAGSGSVACFVARHYTARQVTLFGTSALAVGTTLTVLGVMAELLPFYLGAVIVAGAGFGTCFYGVMRSIIPLATANERGELFATLFTVSYMAFGVPVVIAGLALPHIGLSMTICIYGGVIIVLSAAAGLLRKFGTSE